MLFKTPWELCICICVLVGVCVSDVLQGRKMLEFLDITALNSPNQWKFIPPYFLVIVITLKKKTFNKKIQ